MEDAAIHTINMPDGNSLFAVFDGHGGTVLTTQDMKSANMLATFLLHNSKQ
jgi:serine/threonine protein phosphatase PrpC